MPQLRHPMDERRLEDPKMRIPDNSSEAEFFLPRRSTLDWVLEGVSLIALLTAFAVVAILWRELPRTIPKHYGLFGRPNGWGDKSSLWKTARDAAGLWAVLTIIVVPLGFARRSAARARPIPAYVPELLRLARGHLLTVKTVMMLFLAYLVWATVYTSLGRVPGLGPAFVPAAVVAISLAVIGPMIRILWVSVRYRYSTPPARSR